MTLEPWARRAIGRLQAVIAELEDQDADSEILGLCIVAYRSNASGGLYSSSSACCGPNCALHDMAEAMVLQGGDYLTGRVAVTAIEEPPH